MHHEVLIPMATRTPTCVPPSAFSNVQNPQALLRGLSKNDVKTKQHDLSQGYLEVRGWFFESLQYREWLKGRPWQLCCYGEPECGKASRLESNYRCNVVI